MKKTIDVVVLNLRATRLRKDSSLVEKIKLALSEEVEIVETACESETQQKLHELWERCEDIGIRCVVVIGGDGTFRTVLNWVLSLPQPLRPPIAPVGGGHICYMAEHCGFWPRDPLRGVRLIFENRTPLTVNCWRPVEIQRPGMPSLYCAVFGNGVLYHFLKWMEADEKKHVLVVIWMMIRLAIDAVLNPSARRIGPLQPTHGQLELDGQLVVKGDEYLGAIVSTVPRLSLGFRPFWGERQAGQVWCAAYWGDFRTLAKLVPYLWLGQAPRHARFKLSNQPRGQVTITTTDPCYMLDGDCWPEDPRSATDSPIHRFVLAEGPDVRLVFRRKAH